MKHFLQAKAICMHPNLPAWCSYPTAPRQTASEGGNKATHVGKGTMVQENIMPRTAIYNGSESCNQTLLCLMFSRRTGHRGTQLMQVLWKAALRDQFSSRCFSLRQKKRAKKRALLLSGTENGHHYKA